MSKGIKAGDQPISIDVEKGKNYLWCSCGQSKSQPFCDMSHRGTKFKPVKFVAEENKTIYFCHCKQTNNQPFCDGSHNK